MTMYESIKVRILKSNKKWNLKKQLIIFSTLLDKSSTLRSDCIFLLFCPCADQELRNVIDKLAQFVARNGPEFEKMTMEKQKDNPKFSFLFGGEYFSYYKCKLVMEQQQRM